MTAGVIAYFVCANTPFLVRHRTFILDFVDIAQPSLIFLMLFLTFCKVNPLDLRLRRWHLWLLLFQTLTFSLLSLVLILWPTLDCRVIIEGAMLCLICPTATAAAVITNKLRGDAVGLTTYTILINLVVAIIVPLLVPLVNPHPDLTFFPAFLRIIGKVFPMLICPFILAVIVRYGLPRVHRYITSLSGLAFYIWCFTLPMAIAVTVRSIVHSTVSVGYEIGIALASLLCCIIQFYIGKRLGHHYGCPIAAGQSLGQKNTIFAIWMGYTFLTPISAVAGGFYSLWHNAYNSWQLYRDRNKLNEK